MWWCASIAGIVVGLGCLRLMSNPSMWRDEAMSAAIVDRSFLDMAHVILTREAGMGPYHVGLWFWSLVNGSDQWLRAFSVLAGAATAVVLFRLMARWFDRAVAALSVVFLVANPVFLTYLTEARSYSWSMFLAVLSTLFLTRALAKDASISWTVAYGLAIGVGIGVNAVAVFVPLAHAVATVWSGQAQPRAWRTFALASPIAILTFAPFVPVTLAKGGTQTSWIASLTLEDLPSALTGIVGGSRWALLMLPGVIASAVVAVRPSPGRPRALIEPSRMILTVAILPAALLLIVSEIRPLFVPRYLTPSVPFLAAAAAVGFSELRIVVRWFAPVAAASVAVLLFLVGSPVTARRGLANDDLRAAANYLSAHVADSDAVLFSTPFARVGVTRYWHDRLGLDVAAKPSSEAQVYPKERSTEELRSALRGRDRVWLLGYVSSTDSHRVPAPPQQLENVPLQRPRLETRDFGRISLVVLGPVRIPGGAPKDSGRPP